MKKIIEHSVWIIALILLSCQMNAEEIPVFIFAGQSTAICSGTDGDLLPAEMLQPQTNVLFFNAREHYPITTMPQWEIYKAPTGSGWPSNSGIETTKNSFGPEIITGNLITRKIYNGKRIAIYKYAVGASSIYNDYNPTNNNAPMWQELTNYLTISLTKLNEMGLTGKVSGIFWTQGESDAVDSLISSQAYSINLFNFVCSIRQYCGNNSLPFVYQRIIPQWPNSEYVRAAQENLGKYLTNVCWVYTDDLAKPTKHFDNAGTMELGKRYFNAYVSILKLKSYLTINKNDNKVNIKLNGLYQSSYIIECNNNNNWQVIYEGTTDEFGCINLNQEISTFDNVTLLYRASYTD